MKPTHRPARRTRLLTAVALAAAVAGLAALHLMSSRGSLTIIIDTGSLRLIDGNKAKPLPRGSVVTAELMMPTPRGIIRASADAEAGSELVLTIDARRAVDAWLHSPRGAEHIRQGVYPAATLLITAYTGDEEYMTSVVLGPPDLLRMAGYRHPWKLLSKDPLRGFEEAYVGRTVVLRNLSLTRVNLGSVIDSAAHAPP